MIDGSLKSGNVAGRLYPCAKRDLPRQSGMNSVSEKQIDVRAASIEAAKFVNALLCTVHPV